MGYYSNNGESDGKEPRGELTQVQELLRIFVGTLINWNVSPDPLKDPKNGSPPQYEPITTLGKLGDY